MQKRKKPPPRELEILARRTTFEIKKPYSEAIDFLIQRIVEEVNPLRILLFGSTVHGTTKPDSDIDLLVVMPEGTHRRRTAQHLYRRIRGVGVPFDIIISTPSDLDQHKDNIGLIYYTILSEGKELYAS
jgi:predicted nucleotidyltransferase